MPLYFFFLIFMCDVRGWSVDSIDSCLDPACGQQNVVEGELASQTGREVPENQTSNGAKVPKLPLLEQNTTQL